VTEVKEAPVVVEDVKSKAQKMAEEVGLIDSPSTE